MASVATTFRQWFDTLSETEKREVLTEIFTNLSPFTKGLYGGAAALSTTTSCPTCGKPL